MTAPKLDAIDRRLLGLLQRNNRRPLRDMAEELGVSAPTCLRRFRRLETKGVIQKHAAILNPGRVGLPVTSYVEVSLVNPSGTNMAAFEKRVQKLPEIVHCSEIAGEVDYLLEVVASDMESFGEFTRRHFASDKKIASYRSLIVLRRTKQVHELPI